MRFLFGCVLCLFVVLFAVPARTASSAQKRIVVLDVNIKNDNGVQNASEIATGWLIDSITRVAPDARVIPGRKASKLARIRLPAEAADVPRSAAITLMKSLDSTHLLGAEIFLWKQKYGITLRLIELPDTSKARIERTWAASPDDIPKKIEDLALLLFSPIGQRGSKGKAKAEPKYRLPSEKKTGGVPSRAAELLKKHPEMVYVPGGKFLMGNDNDSDADNIPVDPARREGVNRLVLLAAERPEHRVELKPYLIDKYEVTNAEYRKFRASHEFPAARADHPVTGVSWHDARAYADWAGKRLPTEEEWEKAARGTDGRKWPWGNIFNRNRCNLGTVTAPVGSFSGDKSPYGASDMAGNVQEWTSGSFVAYTDHVFENVAFDPEKKVVRGSYYGGNDFLARCSMRFCALPGEPGKRPQGSNYEYIGFRCVMDID